MFISAGDKDKIRDGTYTLSTEPSPCPRKVSCNLCGSRVCTSSSSFSAAHSHAEFLTLSSCVDQLADEGRGMWMAFPSSFRFDHPNKEKEDEKVEGDDNVHKKPKLDSPVMRSIPDAFKVCLLSISFSSALRSI